MKYALTIYVVISLIALAGLVNAIIITAHKGELVFFPPKEYQKPLVAEFNKCCLRVYYEHGLKRQECYDTTEEAEKRVLEYSKWIGMIDEYGKIKEVLFPYGNCIR